MPTYPTIEFDTIEEWENYVNTYVVANGMEQITGPIGNNAYNGAVKFVSQSPLNWGKATVYNTTGAVSLSNNFQGVAIFSTNTPSSLSFGDNFYNQYVFLNLTDGAIPLVTPSAYYDFTGSPVTSIPANSAIILFKASNDLWVLGGNSGGSGSTQKQPKTYVVGTTSGAPTAGSTTWQNSAFANSYVALFLNYGKVNQSDAGNGSPYISKASLASDTITINNVTGGWIAGDVLDYILITP